VHESRLDFGPGYRIYFGSDGDTLVIDCQRRISGRGGPSMRSYLFTSTPRFPSIG
jgi:putative component of toxin-antitoxin plasmid stabilization module